MKGCQIINNGQHSHKRVNCCSVAPNKSFQGGPKDAGSRAIILEQIILQPIGLFCE